MNSIEIYNSLGEIVYEEKNNLSGVIQIETENFKEGVYFYKITNHATGQTEEGKIVIKNNRTLKGNH